MARIYHQTWPIPNLFFPPIRSACFERGRTCVLLIFRRRLRDFDLKIGSCSFTHCCAPFASRVWIIWQLWESFPIPTQSIPSLSLMCLGENAGCWTFIGWNGEGGGRFMATDGRNFPLLVDQGWVVAAWLAQSGWDLANLVVTHWLRIGGGSTIFASIQT